MSFLPFVEIKVTKVTKISLMQQLFSHDRTGVKQKICHVLIKHDNKSLNYCHIFADL